MEPLRVVGIEEHKINALLDAVRLLLDHDVLAPYHSAWEIRPEHDGEELWERLRVAADAIEPGIAEAWEQD